MMNHINHDIRLTDELERQLMMKAIEDQFRFKPFVSLKNLLAKLSGAANKSAAKVGHTPRTAN